MFGKVVGRIRRSHCPSAAISSSRVTMRSTIHDGPQFHTRKIRVCACEYCCVLYNNCWDFTFQFLIYSYVVSATNRIISSSYKSSTVNLFNNTYDNLYCFFFLKKNLRFRTLFNIIVRNILIEHNEYYASKIVKFLHVSLKYY